MLTSKQRAALRKHANSLTPVFQIGKDGIDTPLIKAASDCLAVRELIKVKQLETSPHPTKDAAEELATQTGAEVVQVIGRTIVLFRQKKKESAFTAVYKL